MIGSDISKCYLAYLNRSIDMVYLVCCQLYEFPRRLDHNRTSHWSEFALSHICTVAGILRDRHR